MHIRITTVKHDNERQMAYRVIFENGGELITNESDLLSLKEIINSVPGKKGIIATERLSSNTWKIVTNK